MCHSYGTLHTSHFTARASKDIGATVEKKRKKRREKMIL